jgi:alpha-L-glutamate ligase-like protein/uncharacterized protein (TIGR02421 family)
MLPFLSHHGVLGLNARNLLYIKPFNPKKAMAFADDKLKTKAYLGARGIPVAKVYGRIENHRQLRSFDFRTLPDTCVLKPNYGFGGGGILVLKGRDKNGDFLEQGKTPVPERLLREHIEDILDGKFSVNGLPDTAFFEKILIPDPAFAPFRPSGLPDIRIVVFNLVPVMAMLRVPTSGSGGKANVHLGGIGIGIDIAKGTTTFATQYNKRLRTLPHGASPSGIDIPHWEELLLIASRIQSITNIGYLAVDLTLDADMGPCLLEVNARAGLMVQVANLAPLRSRLERIEGLKVTTPEKGVLIARELFGSKTPAASQAPEAPRPVLGLSETLTVTGSGASIDVPCRIAPDEERSIFSPALITQLRKAEAAEPAEGDDGLFRVKFTLGGQKIQTIVREGIVSPASVRAVIGRRDLAPFLIDPSKTSVQSPTRGSVKEDVRAVDKALEQADDDLHLLKHVKPANLTEERERARDDRLYNPVFQYVPPAADLDEIESRLSQLAIDESPLGLLFKKKRRELLQRITLIRSRGSARAFTDASCALFGQPSSVLITGAKDLLQSRTACDLPEPEASWLTTGEVQERFEKILSQYGLDVWHVSVRENTVARCTVGGHGITLRAGTMFPPSDVEGLIAHEIETHVLTAENGEHQPYAMFRSGFANYLDTQEGLAIYNQNRVLPPHHEKRLDAVRSLLGVAFALEHSFAETREYLEEELGYTSEKALTKAMDIKRGIGDTSESGAFTKGIVYFRGLRAIEHFTETGGDLRRLYIGKIALEDLDILETVGGVKKPLLLPKFLQEHQEPAKKTRKRSDKEAKK